MDSPTPANKPNPTPPRRTASRRRFDEPPRSMSFAPWLLMLGLVGGLFWVIVFVWPKVGPRWIRAIAYLGLLVAVLNTV